MGSLSIRARESMRRWPPLSAFGACPHGCLTLSDNVVRMRKIVVKTRTLKPGDVVSVENGHGDCRLPQGLEDKTIVTVVRTATGYAHVVDGNGHPWTLPSGNIEMPCSLWWKGEWIDRMTHPEGHAAWTAFLRQSAEAAKVVCRPAKKETSPESK